MSQFTFQEQMKKLRRTGSCVQDKIFGIVLGLISGKHMCLTRVLVYMYINLKNKTQFSILTAEGKYLFGGC